MKWILPKAMSTFRVFLPAAFYAISFGFCQASYGEDDVEDLLTLVQLMETDIATKTDLQDPDRSPGLVTVLPGEELRARGYRTVRQALTHQAGFDITIDSRGIVTPAVRGIGGVRSGASGKVKLMVNGTMTNVVRAGAVEDGMELPINLVDRIEIIRGPGSAVHGEFAYAAVVNIITRKGDSELSAFYGNEGNRGVDGMLNFTSEMGMSFDLLGSFRETDPEVKAGKDALYSIGQGDISQAPGMSNEFHDSQFLMANLGYEDSELRFLWSNNGYGDYFGLSASLGPEDDEIRRENEFWYLEGHQLLALSENTDLRFKAGYQFFSGDFKNITVQPPGYSVVIPPIPAFQFPGMQVVYADGIRAATSYEEERYSAGSTLTYRGFEKHTLLVGVEYAKIENTESTGSINLDLDNPNPLFALLPTPQIENYSGELASIKEGQVREITSLYVQDEFRPTESVTITTGARYDSYSDVKDSINPRLAVVYQLDDHHILKAQYGSAFRPPTYAELFSAATTSLGNPDIEPETIDTYELGWIYKTNDLVTRVTFFYSDLENLIVLTPTGFGTQSFTNIGGAESQGVELEGEVSLSRMLKFTANLSWIDTKDDMTGASLEGAADIMSSMGLIYQPRHDMSVNIDYRYVGERHRSVADSRADVEESQTVDVTLNRFNFMGVGVTLRAGIYNLFDEDVRFPAPVNTYPEDFPRPGRTWLLEVSKTFK